MAHSARAEVRPGAAPAPPPSPPGSPFTPVTMGTVAQNPTIPFVFKGDGNLKSRRFYKSNNTRVGN